MAAAPEHHPRRDVWLRSPQFITRLLGFGLSASIIAFFCIARSRTDLSVNGSGRKAPANCGFSQRGATIDWIGDDTYISRMAYSRSG